MPVQEWSDEKTSLQLCADCLRVKAYIDGIVLPVPVQTPLPRDWWADWCIWYEIHKSEIWKDVPNAIEVLGGKQ